MSVITLYGIGVKEYNFSFEDFARLGCLRCVAGLTDSAVWEECSAVRVNSS